MARVSSAFTCLLGVLQALSARMKEGNEIDDYRWLQDDYSQTITVALWNLHGSEISDGITTYNCIFLLRSNKCICIFYYSVSLLFQNPRYG
jgi:hypothetical protein